MTYLTKQIEMTETTTFPTPSKPYPDWSRFVRDLWVHGMSVHNIDPLLVETHVEQAAKAIRESMTRRQEAQMVRPSAFLACARQTYFAVQGEQGGSMPDNIGPTFAVGHLLHELSYAAIHSAAPKGLKVETEKEVLLPDWWPDDWQQFNQHGHIDMLLTFESPEVQAKFVSESEPIRVIVDFKTMGGFSFKKHGKTIWGEDPDGFGYLAQLAVYADALDYSSTDTGVLIAGINRDSLAQPLLPRRIPKEALDAEVARVKVAVETALEGSDPGEEFLIRHNDEAYFYCGRGGRPGYCPFRETCRQRPSAEWADL